MPQPDCPRCPQCTTRDGVYPDGDRQWWCQWCKLGFDSDPDEGGTHSDDPVRSAERNEEHEAKQAAYRKRPHRHRGVHRHRRTGR